MSLTVVATYPNLQEAQIAAGALQSGGLHAQVMDLHFGSVMWTDQFALQGFRVAVHEDEADDAVAYLSRLPPATAATDQPGSRAPGLADASWRLLAFIAGIVMLPVGWLMVGGLRTRPVGAIRASLAGVLLVTIALSAAGAIAYLVLNLVFNYVRP